MIEPQFFVDTLSENGVRFFAGVPDSLLKNLCAYITDHLEPNCNIIAANEGGAMGLAAGYHLATSHIPAVYMQNSGEGNAVNPLLSLTDKEVYHIPVLLIIGWRGEPGVKDEPQHVKQGKVTLSLLESMGIEHAILSSEESEAERQIEAAVSHMRTTGEAYALVVRKGTFSDYKLQNKAENALTLSRERAIEVVTESLEENAVVVSTTGMISRELFEYRTRQGQGHGRDFLTVGSMGHASQIALGVALHAPGRKVLCFDGDGAAIMHLGGMAIVGNMPAGNLVHVVFNNGAHDSVGGQPTVGLKIDLPKMAKAAGYAEAFSVSDEEALRAVLEKLKALQGPLFLEVKVKRGTRADLGRPTTTPVENKEAFMQFIQSQSCHK